MRESITALSVKILVTAGISVRRRAKKVSNYNQVIGFLHVAWPESILCDFFRRF